MATTHDDYVIERNGDTVTVRHGKFSADLKTLEETGNLTSKSGRTHPLPAWLVHQLASEARTMTAA